jgi:hypothetical protein
MSFFEGERKDLHLKGGKNAKNKEGLTQRGGERREKK